MLHSPEYRRRYADFLKLDFPRIPLTRRKPLFGTLVKLGRRLAELHLMKDGADSPTNMPSFEREGDLLVDKIRYEKPSGDTAGRVWINKAQCFENVTARMWEFTIGGYQPARKWLTERKGRRLSSDEIDHYCRICGALEESASIMARIDEAVEQHGGWPLN